MDPKANGDPEESRPQDRATSSASPGGSPSGEEAAFQNDAGSVSPDEDQSRLRCTVLGPGNAGKTSLIDSLDQACADPLAYEGPIQLEYLGGRQSREQAERFARTVDEASFSPPPSDRT